MKLNKDRLRKILCLITVISCGQSFADSPKTWVLLGDSIMSNVAPSTIGGDNGGVITATAIKVSIDRNIFIRNLSSPAHSLGSTDHTGFGNITPSLLNLGGYHGKIDGIIIQAGTNDYGRNIPWEDTVTSLRKIMSYAKVNAKPVILMGIIYRDKEDGPNNLGYSLNTYRFFSAIVCSEFPGTCFYGGIDGNTSLSAKNDHLYDPKEVAIGKALHLNAEGHKEYTRWLESTAVRYGLF